MRSVVVAVVALVVGVGIGYLLGASREAPARAPLQHGAAPAEASKADDPIARSLGVPPSGSGTITGHVGSADGTPLAGALVCAIPRGDPHLGAAAQHVIRAVTGSDGNFALEGLADGRYFVDASLEGFEIEPARPEVATKAWPGMRLDFVALAVVEVTFDVVLPDGTAAPEATVRMRDATRAWERGWSPKSPRIAVPPGCFTCSAERAHGEYRSDEVTLAVAEGAPSPPTLRLQLTSRPGIRGTLFFAKDLPFAGACVFALPFRGAMKPDTARFFERDDQHVCGTSPGDGFQYRILDLAPGRYLVGVSVGLTVIATREVDVGDGIGTCDFAIDAIDPGLYVVVRVLDPAGQPVRDATFGTGYRTEDGASGSGVAEPQPMRPDGSYLVMHHVHTHEEGGTYQIDVVSPRYGRKEISYRREDTRDLVVRFGEPATLELTVKGYAASEYRAELTVALLPFGEPRDPYAGGPVTTAPDAKGQVILGPVQSGDYEVTLYVGGEDGFEGLPTAPRRVALRPGRNTLSLPMPSVHQLRVLDPKGRPGQSFAVHPESDPISCMLVATLDEDLRATFAALPEGRYQLAREDAADAMIVVIPGPAEVEFRPGEYDALRVLVNDSGGAWAKAGLADGDLIVAINDDDLVSAATLTYACVVLRTNEKVTLKVLRGGSPMEVTASTTGLFGGGAGGRIEWAKR